MIYFILPFSSESLESNFPLFKHFFLVLIQIVLLLFTLGTSLLIWDTSEVGHVLVSKYSQMLGVKQPTDV